MAAGAYADGAVLIAFGAGLAFGRRRHWASYDRTARRALVVRAGLPLLLGATALSSAADAPTALSAVLLGAFGVLVVVAVVLGWRVRRYGR